MNVSQLRPRSCNLQELGFDLNCQATKAGLLTASTRDLPPAKCDTDAGLITVRTASCPTATLSFRSVERVTDPA